MMHAWLQTIVETPAYLAAAKGAPSDDERARVVVELAGNPKAGGVLGGGIRKMRISRPGRGRSGGARVVFLSSGEDVPVFLLTLFFAKNDKANLGVRERAELAATARRMVESYRRRG